MPSPTIADHSHVRGFADGERPAAYVHGMFKADDVASLNPRQIQRFTRHRLFDQIRTGARVIEIFETPGSANDRRTKGPVPDQRANVLHRKISRQDQADDLNRPRGRSGHAVSGLCLNRFDHRPSPRLRIVKDAVRSQDVNRGRRRSRHRFATPPHPIMCGVKRARLPVIRPSSRTPMPAGRPSTVHTPSTGRLPEKFGSS